MIDLTNLSIGIGGDRKMGGAFYRTLARYGKANLLGPVRAVLDEPLGSTSFGEVVRIFRNKEVVHTSFRDKDLDHLGTLVDMEDADTQARFQELMVRVYQETKMLAVELAKTSGRPLSHFGIQELSTP